MNCHRLTASAILFTLLALVPTAEAQFVWQGLTFDGSWNDPGNWVGGVPNSPGAAVTFPTQDPLLYNVNIQSSVQAGTLLFTNTSGNYNLTSNPGQTLSGVTNITVANGVTTTDTINLANVGSGSLLSTNHVLFITNNATLGTNPTLVIGPNTVINQQGAISVSGTGFTTISGTIASGAGTLAKGGSGTLILSGTNSYVGGTVIGGGVLSIASEANLGSAPGGVTLDGGTLQFTGSGAITALSANRLLTVTTGGGSSGGKIDTSGLGAGDGNITTFASAITGSQPLTLAAHGDTSDTGNGSSSLLTFSGPSTFTGPVTITSGLVDGASTCFVNAGNTITITGGGLVGTLTPTTINRDITLSGTGDRFFRVYGGSTLTLGGVIDGSGSLRKTDAGTLLLSGANTYTGGTTIGDGTLQLGATGTLPSATALTLANNTMLDLNGFSNTVGSVLLYAGANISTGTGTLSTSGPVTCVSGSQTTSISGNFDMQGGTTFDVPAGTTPSGVDLDLSANISNGSLTKNGSGTLTLSGANSYAGATQINEGVLNGAAANTVPFNSAVSVSGGATFNLGGYAQTIGSLAGAGHVTTFGTTGTDLLTVGADNSNTSFSGVISDALGGRTLAMTKVGSGVFTLSGANTFTGDLNINGGTVTMSGSSLLGNVVNSATFVYNAGTFGGRLINAGVAVFNSDFVAGNGMENDANVSIPSGRTLALGGLGLDNEGTLTMSGGTLILSTAGNAADMNRGTFYFSSTVPFNLSGATFTNSGAMSLSGGLVSGATGSLINGAGGSLFAVGTITSMFNNSGVFSVGSGTLNITHPFTNTGLIQMTAANSNLTGGAISNAATVQGIGIVNSPLNNFGVVRASGGELELGSIDDTNTVGAQIQASTGNTVLYVQGLASNAGTIALSGGAFDNNNHTLSNTGLINGYGVLRTGGLSNTGMLNVGEGNMDVFGSVVNNGTIGIQGSRSVYFYGNVSGAGSFTGLGTATFLASLSPGNSPAAVSFSGNVDLSSSSTLNIELGGITAGSQYDKLNVADQLSLGGMLNVILYNGFTPTAGEKFDILDWGTRTGTFSSIQLPALSGSLEWNISQLYATGTVTVVDSNYLPGDFNRDGHVNAADILIAEQALTNTSGYRITHGLTDPALFNLVADVNGDGVFNNADLQFLLVQLKNGNGSADPVPEPASWVLAFLALAMVSGTHFSVRYVR